MAGEIRQPQVDDDAVKLLLRQRVERRGRVAHGRHRYLAALDQANHRIELRDVVLDEQQILRPVADEAEQRVERLRQRLFGYRLLEVRDGSEVERALPLLGAGDHVHRNVRRCRVGLELLEQAPAIGIGQTDVERYRIGTETSRQREPRSGREGH